MRFKWDPAKNELLKKSRSMGFEQVKEVFFGPHCVKCRSDDPEQWIAIGWAAGRLWSVIFEERTDNEGQYYHLVTLWKSTNQEEVIYERES